MKYEIVKKSDGKFYPRIVHDSGKMHVFYKDAQSSLEKATDFIEKKKQEREKWLQTGEVVHSEQIDDEIEMV